MSAERNVISREVLTQRRLAQSEGNPPITETIAARALRQKARNIITGNWMPDDTNLTMLSLTSEGPIDHDVVRAAQSLIGTGFHFEIKLQTFPVNGYKTLGMDVDHILKHGGNGYNYYPKGTVFRAPADLIEAARSRLKKEAGRAI